MSLFLGAAVFMTMVMVVPVAVIVSMIMIVPMVMVVVVLMVMVVVVVLMVMVVVMMFFCAATEKIVKLLPFGLFMIRTTFTHIGLQLRICRDP